MNALNAGILDLDDVVVGDHEVVMACGLDLHEDDIVGVVTRRAGIGAPREREAGHAHLIRLRCHFTQRVHSVFRVLRSAVQLQLDVHDRVAGHIVVAHHGADGDRLVRDVECEVGARGAASGDRDNLTGCEAAERESRPSRGLSPLPRSC